MVGGARPAGFRSLHLGDAGLARNLGSGETELLGSSSTTFCRMHTVSVVVVVERFRCFAFSALYCWSRKVGGRVPKTRH